MNDEKTNGCGRLDRFESNIEALTEQNKIFGERTPRFLALKPIRKLNLIT